MSSTRLERFQTRHPREREAIARLEALLSSSAEAPEPYRFTLDQLADEVHAKSRDELALILGELSAAGVVDYWLQVRSPITKQPIAGYRSMREIPRVLKDKTTDSEFIVDFDNVLGIYEFRRPVG